MLRLKMTTSVGKVFLGPFVYDLDEKQAKRKLRKMDWLVPKNNLGESIGEAHLEFIEVGNYLKEAVYDDRTVTFVPIGNLEKKWRKLDANYKEDFDEMEEGSVSDE